MIASARLTRALVSIVALVILTSIAACAHRVGGNPYGPWELRGAIVAVTDQRLSIRHKTGQVVDLVMDDRTEVLHDQVREGRDALRRGRRVRVEVEPLATGGSLARVVRVYGGGGP